MRPAAKPRHRRTNTPAPTMNLRLMYGAPVCDCRTRAFPCLSCQLKLGSPPGSRSATRGTLPRPRRQPRTLMLRTPFVVPLGCDLNHMAASSASSRLKWDGGSSGLQAAKMDGPFERAFRPGPLSHKACPSRGAFRLLPEHRDFLHYTLTEAGLTCVQ